MSSGDTQHVSTESDDKPRRVGRPRASGVESEGDVRTQILQAAAVLFVQQGYTGSSTREIAAAAGLRQGLLVHYFPKKQDIFTALLTRSLDESLATVAELSASSLAPEDQLFRLVHEGILELCVDRSSSLMLLPEAKQPEFASFWAQREVLRSAYRNLISAGCEVGSFAVDDLTLATDAAIGAVESVVIWFDADNATTPAACADHLAGMIIGHLLDDQSDLDAIVAAANEALAEP